MLSEMNEKSFLSFSPANQNKLYLCGEKLSAAERIESVKYEYGKT